MLASASTPLRAAVALPAQASRSFSSSPASLLSRRKELVELLVDVPGLGRKDDRIFVSPGNARWGLAPRRLARVVPNWKWYKIGPYRWKPSMSKAAQIRAPTEEDYLAARKASQAAKVEPTPQNLLDRFYLLPVSVTFKLRTAEDGKTLHGSLTLPMISQRLAKLGVRESEVAVAWADEAGGDRMKSTGERKARLSIIGKGEESISLDVKVVPETGASVEVSTAETTELEAQGQRA